MDTAERLKLAALSERDICTKFITPALAAAGWNTHSQMREEVNLTRTLRARLTDARAVQALLASALVDEVAA